jgi:hypothetical protein
MEKGLGDVRTSPATFSDSLFYALYVNTRTKTDNIILFLLDYKGNIKRQSAFRFDPSLYMADLKIIKNKNYLTIRNIGKFELTPNLENLPQSKIKNKRAIIQIFLKDPGK